MLHKFYGMTPEIGSNSYMAPSADIIGNVKIGEDVSVWHGSVLRGDVNAIIVGDRTNIQDLSVLHCAYGKNGETVLGDDVTVGHKVILHACKIGNAVLVGMGAVVLDGAEIGDESVVAASSLVTKGKVFPPRSLIMGSPAEVKRELTDEEIKHIYKSAADYILLKNEYLKP